MKKLLIHYRGDSPICVEGFAEGCERSCVGSLHLVPKGHRTITSDEYEHMQKKYAWISKLVRVVSATEEVKTEAVMTEPAPVVSDDVKPADGMKRTWKKGK